MRKSLGLDSRPETWLRTYTANFGQVNTSKRLTALGKGARREYQQGKVDREKGFRSDSVMREHQALAGSQISLYNPV